MMCLVALGGELNVIGRGATNQTNYYDSHQCRNVAVAVLAAARAAQAATMHQDDPRHCE